MKNTLWEIFELMVTVFECAVSMHFVCRFLGLEKTNTQNNKRWLGLTLCSAIAVTTINTLTPYEGAFIFIYSIIVFIYATIFLHGTMIKKALASILFLCIIIMNSSLGVNLVASLMKSTASNIYSEYGITRFITLLIVQSLNLLVFQILEKTICGKVLKLDIKEWILLGSVFLLSVICLTLIQIAALRIQTLRAVQLCFIGVDLAVIFIDYITIRLITALHRHHQTELENSQMKMQLRYQIKYVDTVRQQEESVHRLRHDFKTTISAMYDFLNNNQLIEMRKYLDTYSDSLLGTASIVQTDQPFLNAILNTKMTFAKENGIVCSCHSPQKLPLIEGIDYCSLLGNLLDNAIESSMKSKVREISVMLDYLPPKLTISVKNKIQESVLESNPSLHTTKGKRSGHGYGISTVAAIADKYHGTVDYYEDNGWFAVVVVLYYEHEEF